MAVIHFLLVYDLNLQRLIEPTREFRDAQEAAVAYAALEATHCGDKDVEIVLVGADSIDTIMQTHGQYFHQTAGESDKYLVQVK
jgi:hypothetical protein